MNITKAAPLATAKQDRPSRWYHPQSMLDKIFEGSIILKGISGVLEFIGGALLIFITPEKLHNYIVLVTQRQRLQDPNDIFATMLMKASEHFTTNSRTFAIAFLWIHAAIKMIAVYGLLRNQLWAFPFSLVTLGALMLYQLYSIVLHFSIGMTLLTLFDVFILWLIWHEWEKAKQKHVLQQSQAA